MIRLPEIHGKEPFDELIAKLAQFVHVLIIPCTHKPDSCEE